LKSYENSKLIKPNNYKFWKQWGLGFSPSHTLAPNQEVKEKAEELVVVEATLDHDWAATANGRRRWCLVAATRRVQGTGHS